MGSLSGEGRGRRRLGLVVLDAVHEVLLVLRRGGRLRVLQELRGVGGVRGLIRGEGRLQDVRRVLRGRKGSLLLRGGRLRPE